MLIHGLQKMTLLDFPGKVACTVFLGGCDFRCPFCHNWELLDGSYPPVMNSDDFFAFLKKRIGLLDGVAITGGEPMLRPELPDFLSRIRALGFAVKVDTNGNHPAMLKKILEENSADYIAMDIKNSPERYGETIGIPDFDLKNVKESVKLLLQSKTDYEFRTTVTEQFHNAASFRSMGPWIAGAKQYFLQPFTDRDTVPTEGLCAPDGAKLEQYRSIMSEYIPNAQVRGG